MIYEVVSNQEIQNNLRKEINEVLEQFEGEISENSIKQMKYLEMVYKETLRKWPVVVNQFRKTRQQFKIPKTTLKIPRKTLIVIPTFQIHRDERFYENPQEFDPQRFSEKGKINRKAFIPFSDGPRRCLGEFEIYF